MTSTVDHARTAADLTQVRSLCAAFQATAAARPDEVALRTADGSVELTWRQYADRVRSIAAGLAAKGVGRGDTVGLLMANRPEFHLVDAAAMHLGAAPFSLYQTSPPEQLEHVFANSGCRVVVSEVAYLDRIRAARSADGEPGILVTLDGEAEGAITLEDLEAAGDDDFDFDAAWQVVEPADVLTLIYTSGTTGPPKGVELTHANLLSQLRQVASVLSIEPGDSITSYLPSAHIADRWSAHYNGMAFGVQVTSVADMRTIGQVLPALRPTLWGGVPRVMEKLKAGLEAAIAAEPDEARRGAMEKAIQVGIDRVRLLQAGEPVPEELEAAHRQLDERILSQIRARIGLDRVKWVIVGAAPTPVAVKEFLLGVGLPLTEVYGLSEISCIATVASTKEARVSTVGPPIPELEARLDDDGELLFRGPTVMRGYRNDPVRTAEVLDDDGWFRTGDIAELEEHGQIRIVDRKKELIINAAGKNMSPANIELALKSANPLIGQVAVIGDGRPYNVALLVLDPDLAAARAKAMGREGATVDEMAQDPDIQAEVADAVERANATLSRVEQVKRFRLLATEWMPGGDELTPTMKLKRKPIDAKYAEAIEELYADT